MSRAVRVIALAGLVVAISAAARPAEKRAGTAIQSPGGVVRALYADHFAGGMAFTPESIRHNARWLDSTLVKLCLEYFERPAPEDDLAAIDGDPFTDFQDFATSFSVGRAQRIGDLVEVPVTLSFPGRTRTISTILRAAGGSWRLTDIRYDDARTLRRLLAPAP